MEKPSYFTKNPHPAVLQEMDYVYIPMAWREVIEEAEKITKSASETIVESTRDLEALPRWKNIAKFAISAYQTWVENNAKVYDAKSYVIPRNLKLDR
jgi:hypothetical protein